MMRGEGGGRLNRWFVVSWYVSFLLFYPLCPFLLFPLTWTIVCRLFFYYLNHTCRNHGGMKCCVLMYVGLGDDWRTFYMLLEAF